MGLVPALELPPRGEVVEVVPPVEDDPPVDWVADELLLALEPAAADELRLAPPALDEPPAALEELAPPELEAELPPWLLEAELLSPPEFPPPLPEVSLLPEQAMSSAKGKQRAN